MVTCPAVTCNSSFQQQTGKVKKKENTCYSANTFCVPKSSLLPPPEQSHLCLVSAWDSYTAKSFLKQMQRVVLKLISPEQSISAPPCLTTKIHRFGWYNSVCAGGFCHVLSIRDHTSSHPKSPEPQQQKQKLAEVLAWVVCYPLKFHQHRYGRNMLFKNCFLPQ